MIPAWSDDLGYGFGGALDVEEDQAELGAGFGHYRQHGIAAGVGEQHIAVLALDQYLFQLAARQLLGRAGAEAENAAPMAPIRSSSSPAGSREAIIRPSVEITPRPRCRPMNR